MKGNGMTLSRRQFLKNTTIGTAALVGGSSLLKKNSAFAAYPAPATSRVAFIGGTSSYTGGRKQMIKDVLAPLQSVIAARIAGKTVIIKPNLVFASESGTQAVLNCTHVDAVRGVIEFLRTINSSIPIIVAEASASASAPTSSMFDWCGYNTLPTEYTGVTLVDLNTSSSYPAVTKHIWKTDLSTTLAVNVTPICFDSNNYIISLTRPKTHNCMVMTATVKNMCMGMPLISSTSDYSGNSKLAMHDVSDENPNGQHTGEDAVLAYNIYQIASQFTPKGFPNLAVLDAWEGQEQNGPVSGTSIMHYCALAGTDFLAVDRLCAKLMGFSDTAIPKQGTTPTPSYTDMRALVWMSNSGFGNYNLSKIQLLNSTMTTLSTFIKNYTLADNYAKTGDVTTSYETLWADSTNLNWGPTTILDNQLTGVEYRDGTPILNPQANMHTNGVVTGNDVKVDLTLPHGYFINLGIFNMQGQEIRRLGHEYLHGGRYSMVWDCRDEHGSRVPNGNYIIKLQFDSRAICDRVALAR